MSRAVRILKPLQGANDLELTTRGLVSDLHLNDSSLRTLAAEYTDYQRKQPVANFHGLRDYYALIKGLGGNDTLAPSVIKSSLARNFGGGAIPPEDIYRKFFPRLS